MGTLVISGKDFGSADDRPGQHVAIVNEEFVRVILEGRSALGRRFQFVDRRENPSEPNVSAWYEIVGVVKQIPMEINPEREHARGIYLPLGCRPDLPGVNGPPSWRRPDLVRASSS
jgi:hypothetical protein